jgi:hypothetical protein
VTTSIGFVKSVTLVSRPAVEDRGLIVSINDVFSRDRSGKISAMMRLSAS